MERTTIETEIKILQDLNKQEKKLQRFLQKKEEKAVYHNRIMGEKNLLFGAVTDRQTEQDLYICIYSDTQYEFDEYNRESIESIIHLTNILLDMCEYIMESEANN